MFPGFVTKLTSEHRDKKEKRKSKSLHKGSEDEGLYQDRQIHRPKPKWKGVLRCRLQFVTCCPSYPKTKNSLPFVFSTQGTERDWKTDPRKKIGTMSLYFGYFSHFRHQSNLTPPSLISNPSAFIDFKLSVPWSPLPGRFPFQMYSQRESKNRLQTRRIYVQPYDMVSDPSPTTSQLSNYLQVLQYVTTL